MGCLRGEDLQCQLSLRDQRRLAFFGSAVLKAWDVIFEISEVECLLVNGMQEYTFFCAVPG